MKHKSLKDISWLVDEPTYRADKALSYSTLAKYERTGFEGLSHLFDKLETPSLTHGSAVDALITGGQEEFDNNFMVAEYPECSDTIKKIVKLLFKKFCDTNNTLESIPNNEVIDFANSLNYQSNWKPETRAKVIKEKGTEYYNLLYIAGDKTILSTKEYEDVINCVDALHTSRATEWYFAPNNPFEEIERLYQLKFKATFDGIPYRCMADLIILDYVNKIIQPIDLKTSSHFEWDFFKSFIDWNYQIQARLYWRIIRDNIMKDEYFKDFTLLPYKFIVANKRTLVPLVWEYSDTCKYGSLRYSNDKIECRDPFDIGKELSYYLTSRPKVPIGIEEEGDNNLINWLNTL